jgi:prepilin-type processing-associated H-X9-DG protein
MYAGENDGKFPPASSYLPNSNVNFLSFAGEKLYPDYWNDISIAICPSDPRVDGVETVNQMKVEEDWSQQVQDVAAGANASAYEQNVAEACRNALISVPVSYTYTAYAQSTMADWACMARMLAIERWDRDTVRGEIGVTNEFWETDDLTDVNCPDWTGLLRIEFDEDLTTRTDLTWTGTNNPYRNQLGGDQLRSGYPRLREGVERFFITDINNPGAGSTGQSTMAVMWDAWGGNIAATFMGGQNPTGQDAGSAKMNHIPGGSNVLYMDGHVEFVRYQSRYPMLPEGEYGSTTETPIVLIMATRAGGMG